MRDYIPIDGTVAETVFEVGSGCCRGDEQLEDVQAHVYSKSGGPCLLTYSAWKVNPCEITFKWDEDFYALSPGWYLLDLRTKGCRFCGVHTVRIGKDCYANWARNHMTQTVIDDCDKEVPMPTVVHDSNNCERC